MKKIKLVLKAILFCVAAALSMGIAQALPYWQTNGWPNDNAPFGTNGNFINNWSFELPAQTAKIQSGFNGVTNWFSNTNFVGSDTGIETGTGCYDGTRQAFLKDSDGIHIEQTTSHLIQQGECFLVSVGLKNEFVNDANMIKVDAWISVSLFYGGTTNTEGIKFSTNNILVHPSPNDNNNIASDFTNYFFGVITDAVPFAALGQPIGIDIWQTSSQYNTNVNPLLSWIAVDGVAILSTNGIPPLPGGMVVTPANWVWGGETLNFSESVSGSTPMSYQWQTDGGGGGILTNIDLATNTSLDVVTSTNVGSYKYRVIITNSYGGVTSPITPYTVRGRTPPFVTQSIGTLENGPVTNILAYSGSGVNLYAAFDGVPPITNQWSFGSTTINNATNNLYVLNNVTDPASVGWYQYSATNYLGYTNTPSAHLTVLAKPGAPENIGTNMYTFCVMTNFPWAYWKFEETNDTINQSMQAYDYSGNNFDATYGTNTTDGRETIANVGIHGPRASVDENSHYAGFPLTNGAAGMGGDVTAPLANGYLTVPPLNLNTNTVTFTMWIHPNGAAFSRGSGLLMYRNGSDGAGVGFGSTTNALGTPCLSYTWNSNSAPTSGWNTGLYPIPQIWSFVACVVTPTNTSMYMYYINGASTNLLKAAFAMTNNPESFGGGTTRLGGDSGGGDGRTFAGSMDEVAIFTNSMSENQIQDLFLKALGLNTGIAPSISTQPANTTLYAGTTLQLSVTAGGIPNPTYQWQYSTNYAGNPGAWWTNVVSGGTVTGGNSNVLTITGFPANSWVARTNYQVTLNNSSGSITSSVANIVVLKVAGNDGNQLWTVNYSITSTNGGGSGNPFIGRGVLGLGTYWNALNVGTNNQMTNATTFWDDGATVSGINFISQAGQPSGTGSSMWTGTTNNMLLDTYAIFNTTNPTPLVFSPIPNGRYNLALYGCVGHWLNRATKFTVLTNGVVAGSQGLTNLQDTAFVSGDNLAVFTNLPVMNHSLEVDIVLLPCPLNPATNSGEAELNGAQLQLLKYAPAITNFNPLTRTLSWQGGMLSSATNIMGPWTTNSYTSPFTMNPTGHMQFFRIYNPTF
jgi:hypothetical protein